MWMRSRREADETVQADVRGAPEERKQVRLAITSSVIGTSIEWYDFFLYGTAAALVFPKLFFPDSSPHAGTLAAFATYAVGFAARPVGAAIFGHYGDRIGRKATLVATLLLMGISSALIGLLPTYSDIGLWAAVLLVVLRVAQGIGVGGEWGGSVLLAMEWGPKNRRGFVASWPQIGVPIGLLLGNGAVILFSKTVGNFESASFTAAWRWPFWFSLVLVAVGLFIRLRVLETPLFSRVLREKKVERQPVAQVIRRNPKEIVLSALIRLSEQAPFYIFTAFVLAYGTEELGFSKDFMLYSVLAAAALSLFSVPFFGNLSDRIGRKRMYMIGAAGTMLFAFPYFALLESKVGFLVVLAVVVSLIPHDMQYGPQAAFIAETFDTRLRYSGAGLGYQLASVFAGGPAPLIATALLPHSVWWIPTYIVAMCVISLVATSLLPDRTNADLTGDDVRESRLGPRVHPTRAPAGSRR
jgi:metabolite-proton symporter